MRRLPGDDHWGKRKAYFLKLHDICSVTSAFRNGL